MAGIAGSSLENHTIQFSETPVLNGIGPHDAKANKYMEASSELVNNLAEVAVALKAAGDDEQVVKLKQAARKVLEARHEVELHNKALASLKTTYRATGEATDFVAAIKTKVDNTAPTLPYSVEQDEQYLEFLSTVDGDGDEAAGVEQIDDDIAIAGGGLAVNEKCPITGRALTDLENPVQDTKGVVYERAAILQHLQVKLRTSGTCKCPMAGTTHNITMQELVPAAKVIAAKKKQAKAAKRRGGLTQAQEPNDGQEVLDLE